MSTSVTESLKNNYNIYEKKISKVLAGGNVPLIPQMKEKRNYSAKNILFVGGNWERKGGPVLIRAFESLKKIHPDACLTIISSKAPNPGLNDCTVYGKLSLTEVAEQFAKASVFCLPTRLEPFGIVFVEAMMYSLPMVGTNIGAIPDFIIDGVTGYTVPPDDPEALAEALDRLLRNPEISELLGANSFKQYSRFYNWEKVGQRIKSQIEYALQMRESIAQVEKGNIKHVVKSQYEYE